MKLKALKKLLSGIFPPEFGPAFEYCHSVPEIEAVVTAAKIGVKLVNDQAERQIGRDLDKFQQLAKLEAKITHLEALARVSRGEKVPPIAQERVVLLALNEKPHAQTGAPFKDKIGMIKAIREVAGSTLMEAKEKVETVIDRGLPVEVFKGPVDQARAAAFTLNAAGGTTQTEAC